MGPTVRTYSAHSTASPADAWALLARPDAWPAWAPHVRGAWGLVSPEVRDGAIGFARLLGIVPVSARIVDKTPGRSWTWRVGEAVELVHRVEPRPGGCTVATDLRAAAPVEAALAAAYGPVIAWTMRRLAARPRARSRSAPRSGDLLEEVQRVRGGAAPVRERVSSGVGCGP